ncbi:hypothetical protein LAUMK21_04088 [Mycobacterium pseudokansasii]|nr:hypothetical protein LAUMK21_04088 [Mycobacterium pseudokansasii]
MLRRQPRLADRRRSHHSRLHRKHHHSDPRLIARRPTSAKPKPHPPTPHDTNPAPASPQAAQTATPGSQAQPQGGLTHASNLKCYCRTHHLVKTFWGWREQQLPDGTLILTSPAERTHVTTPGSALLFPSLCAPTGELPEHTTPPPNHCTDKTTMMPIRGRTRAQERAQRIAGERRRNRNSRTTSPDHPTQNGPAPPDEPPPF